MNNSILALLVLKRLNISSKPGKGLDSIQVQWITPIGGCIKINTDGVWQTAPQYLFDDVAFYMVIVDFATGVLIELSASIMCLKLI